MAVTAPASKQLLKHTVPVLMILALLLAFSVMALAGRGTLGFKQDQGTAIARGLVTHVLQVRPTANGLSSITLENSTATQNPTAGADLSNDFSQTGQAAQFSFALQAPATN